MKVQPQYSKLERIHIEITEDEIKRAIIRYVLDNSGGLLPAKARVMSPTIELYEDDNSKTVATVVYTFEEPA